jgi:hypothetical protein
MTDKEHIYTLLREFKNKSQSSPEHYHDFLFMVRGEKVLNSKKVLSIAKPNKRAVQLFNEFFDSLNEVKGIKLITSYSLAQALRIAYTLANCCYEENYESTELFLNEFERLKDLYGPEYNKDILAWTDIVCKNKKQDTLYGHLFDAQTWDIVRHIEFVENIPM